MRHATSMLLVIALGLFGCSEEKKKSLPRGEADLWISVAITNDIHGYIMPQPYELPAADGGRHEYTIGGVEWLAGSLEILRARDPVLLLDAGDMFQGTLISNSVNGASVVAAMNHLGYAATAVGNHEFDFGREPEDSPDPFSALKARAAEARFPFLAANILDRGTGEMVTWPGFASHVVVEVSGLKIAILGGTTIDTPKISLPYLGEVLDIRPLEEVIPPLAKRLRAEGADVVIALVHAGGACADGSNPDDISTCEPDAEMFRLARAMDPADVDLIAGAHTHRMIGHRVNGILLVEGGAYMQAFSLVRLRWSREKKKVAELVLEGPIGLCHEIPDGRETCLVLRKADWKNPVPAARRPATFLGQPVRPVPFLDKVFDARLSAGLERAREVLGPVVVHSMGKKGPGDHPIGLLEADILLDSFPRATIALVNESGIRASLPEGPITYGDLFRVFPFKSKPAFLTLTGRELLDLLRVASSGAHGLPVVGGLRLEIDRAADDCIREDWNNDGVHEPWERQLLISATLADGGAIDPAADYVVVSNSYLAAGGSDFARILDAVPAARKRAPEEDTPIRDVVARWLREHPEARLGEVATQRDIRSQPRVKVLNAYHVLGSECEASPPASDNP